MVADYQVTGGKSAAKYCMFFWTVAYILLFFPLLGGILCLSLIAYEELTFWLSIFQIIFFLSVVLSLPTSIYFMWTNYSRGQYKRVHFFWIFPFVVTAIECLFEGLTRVLFR
jgi:hypothetical protein